LLPKAGINAGFGTTLIAAQETTGGDEPVAPAIEASPSLTAQARPAPVPASGAQAPQLPLNALAVHLAAQAVNGAKRFDIRLDPPELGRVEVRLDVRRDGHVTTHLVVERAETLDLLQRDARALERALHDAGLKTSDDGLTFSLKDHGQSRDHPGAKGTEAEAETHGRDRLDRDADAEAAPGAGRTYVATSGLDMRI
jgi:flagellar hook-length control protein FliK